MNVDREPDGERHHRGADEPRGEDDERRRCAAWLDLAVVRRRRHHQSDRDRDENDRPEVQHPLGFVRTRSKPSLKTAISWNPNSAWTPGSTIRASSSVCWSASLTDSPDVGAGRCSCVAGPLIAPREAPPAPLDQPRSPLPTAARDRGEAAALLRIVDDKNLDLVEHGGRRRRAASGIRRSGATSRRRRAGGRCARAGFALVLLLGLDHADDAARHDRPRRHRLVGEDEDVERVAVVAARRRQEAEVVGEREAERQHAMEARTPSTPACTSACGGSPASPR